MRRAAQQALKRAEAILVHDMNNSMVAGYSAYALAALGEGERAKARLDRALLIDPQNHNMRYNFACALCVYSKDKNASLEMLGPVFESITDTFLPYAEGRSGPQPAARRSALPGHAGGGRDATRGTGPAAGD